jgi:hypothetical protein
MILTKICDGIKAAEKIFVCGTLRPTWRDLERSPIPPDLNEITFTIIFFVNMYYFPPWSWVGIRRREKAMLGMLSTGYFYWLGRHLGYNMLAVVC